SQREQERILVGGDERSFGEKALKVAQELDLTLWACHCCPSPIHGFAGDDPANATARIGGVTRSPRNYVDVRMSHGLSRRGAVVDPAVECVRFEANCQQR